MLGCLHVTVWCVCVHIVYMYKHYGVNLHCVSVYVCLISKRLALLSTYAQRTKDNQPLWAQTL